MLPFVPSIYVAQITSTLHSVEEQQYVVENQEIRPLPGKLNDVPVFNSNSPEVIQSEGIMVSTFPSSEKNHPTAHLDYPLRGRFDFFSHHIARSNNDKRILYQGLIVHNPTSRYIRMRILQAVSYLTSPDAPFINLPSYLEDPFGHFFSGPGSRLVGDILRGISQKQFPSSLLIPPQQNRMVFILPLTASNARSTFMRLETDGPVYLADLAMYALPEVDLKPLYLNLNSTNALTQLPPPPSPVYRQPSLSEWRYLVTTGDLAQPRDTPPTPPQMISYSNSDPIYGRVAGVSFGSRWVAKIADSPNASFLTIPSPGQAYSYPLSTVDTGTHGTNQVQSAAMLARYPDTAYRANGNYAVNYNLTFPLINKSEDKQTVIILFQTPLKQDRYSDRLFFSKANNTPIFFRGTVKITYDDDNKKRRVRYYHLVQRQGQQGDPLVKMTLSPREQREVNLEFIYPPDAVPPQVITIKTAGSSFAGVVP
jgi:hypothetical protein